METGDVALRLARYAQEGLLVEDHVRGKKVGTYVKQSSVTSLVRSVIGDNVAEFVQNPSQRAYEVERASNPLAASGNEAIFRSIMYATRKFDRIDVVVSEVRQVCRVTHAATKAVAASLALGVSIAMMLSGQYTWDSGGDGRCKVMQRDAFFLACSDAAMNVHQKEYRRTLLLGVANPPGGEDSWSDDEYDGLFEGEGVGGREEEEDEEREEKEEEEEEEDIAKKGLDHLRLDHKGEASQALKTAAVGFWTQRYPSSDYIDPVLEVILQGGDASANGCVAGAIMGLRCGFGKLPTHWLVHLRGKDWLSELANKYNILLWESH